MATAGAIKVRVALIDRMTGPLEWLAFQIWERKAARHGSGLTQDQMIGARLYHEWRHQDDDLPRRDPSIADPTDHYEENPA